MVSNIAVVLLPCIVASGIITATSFLLMNTVGTSLHYKKCGEYKYKAKKAQKLRKKIQRYPIYAFFIFVCAVLSFIMAFRLEWMIGSEWMIESGWMTISFLTLYIIHILGQMARFCVDAFRVFADDEYD